MGAEHDYSDYKKVKCAEKRAECGEQTENLWVVQNRDNVCHTVDLMLHDDVKMGGV